MRDINDYSNLYIKEGFEHFQVKYRRRKVLERCMIYNHNNILEIGCGMEPLFKYLDEKEYNHYVCVEPSKLFAENAIAFGKNNVTIYNDYFTKGLKLDCYDFDFIVCSSLLHEIEDMDDFLGAIKNNCNKNTIVHINVPNANSMHRILAEESGLIKNVKCMSDRNVKFQQQRIFDMAELKRTVVEAGFDIVAEGTYFLKPFTHDQMYKMVKDNIIDETILDGLYNMCHDKFEDVGSELFLDLKLG